VDAAKAVLDTVKATLQDIKAIADILNYDLSTVVEVDNITDSPLVLKWSHHDHGGFADTPAAIIDPKKPSLFGSQKSAWAVATGTEGRAVYAGEGIEFAIHWDVPFIGSNKCDCNVTGPLADQYEVVPICGAGAKAHMRFAIYRKFLHATFVSQTPLQSSMPQGGSQEVLITMRNTGTLTWTAGDRFALGSQSPQDNFNWGANRIPVTGSIPPGSEAAFRFAIMAQRPPGTYYNFQWRMVRDGSPEPLFGWFGDYTPSTLIFIIDSNAECTQIRNGIHVCQQKITDDRAALQGLNPRNPADKLEITRLNKDIQAQGKQIDSLRQRSAALGCQGV
jgi:hypothetical protein